MFYEELTMVSHCVVRPGFNRSSSFEKALDELQSHRFETELYVTQEGKLILRWFRGGSKWHVVARGPLSTALDAIGENACHWVDARDNATANEANFAVQE